MWAWLSLLILVGTGSHARVTGLDLYYFSPDEALHLAVAAAEGVGAVLDSLAREIVPHSPAFVLLLHGLLRLGDSELFLRGVSLVPGILLLPVLFILGRRLAGSAAGLCMAFAASFGYGIVLTSQIVRSYALLALFLSLALFAFVEYQRRNRAAWLGLYVLTMLASGLMHHSALVAAASIGLVHLAAELHARRPTRQVVRWLGANGVLVLAFLAISFPTVHSLIGSRPHEDAVSGWLRAGYPSDADGWTAALLSLSGYLTSPFSAPWILGAPLLVLAGCFAARSQIARELVLVLGVVVVASVALAWLDLYPLLGTRHCLYLFPFLVIPAGFAVQAAWDALPPRLPPLAASAWRRAKGPVGLLLVGAAALLALLHVRAHEFYRGSHAAEFPVTLSEYQDVMKRFEEQVRPGDLVIADEQTAWYASHEASLGLGETLAPGVARVPLRGRRILYHDTLAHTSPYRFQSALELREFLGRVREVVEPGPNANVWFFTVGFRDSLLIWLLIPGPVHSERPDTPEELDERRAFRSLQRIVARTRRHLYVTGDPEGGGALYALPWSALDAFTEAGARRRSRPGALPAREAPTGWRFQGQGAQSGLTRISEPAPRG